MVKAGEAIFTFRNTHSSIEGEQVLLAGDIPVKVMPMPSAITAGCGLCLRVPWEVRSEAEAILCANCVEIEGTYHIDNGIYIKL